jgi:hypothetical protein
MAVDVDGREGEVTEEAGPWDDALAAALATLLTFHPIG